MMRFPNRTLILQEVLRNMSFWFRSVPFHSDENCFYILPLCAALMRIHGWQRGGKIKLLSLKRRGKNIQINSHKRACKKCSAPVSCWPLLHFFHHHSLSPRFIVSRTLQTLEMSCFFFLCVFGFEEWLESSFDDNTNPCGQTRHWCFNWLLTTLFCICLSLKRMLWNCWV